MGNLTVEQILAGIGIIIALCGGAWKLWGGFKTAVENAVSSQFKSLAESIEGINTQLKRVDMEACKNFLVRCIADFENEQPINETELERFWEQYDHYTKEGHNGYIKHKVETLVNEGKITHRRAG